MRILLLSSERSGSNLLRLMLNAHDAIAGPTAPHVACTLGPVRHLYGDLADEDARRRLAEDMITLTRVHPSPWPVTLEAGRVAEAAEPRTFWGTFDALYRLLAESDGKTSWASKENFLFDWAPEIFGALDDVRLIHLVRDGRDVACSMRRAAAWAWHVHLLAEMWNREQAACLNVAADLRGRRVLLTVRYEDLVADPAAELQKVTEFLGVGYQPRMLEFHETTGARETAASSQFWQNLSRPVMSGNAGKWRTELSPGQRRLFERSAGAMLARFGYETEFGDDARPVGILRKGLAHVTNGLAWRLRRRRRYLREPNRAARRQAEREIFRRLDRAGANPDREI